RVRALPRRDHRARLPAGTHSFGDVPRRQWWKKALPRRLWLPRGKTEKSGSYSLLGDLVLQRLDARIGEACLFNEGKDIGCRCRIVGGQGRLAHETSGARLPPDF